MRNFECVTLTRALPPYLIFAYDSLGFLDSEDSARNDISWPELIPIRKAQSNFRQPGKPVEFAQPGNSASCGSGCASI